MDVNAIEADLEQRLGDAKKTLDEFGTKMKGSAADASAGSLHDLHKAHMQLEIKKAEFKLNAEKEKVKLELETKKNEFELHGKNEKAKLEIEAELEKFNKNLNEFKEKFEHTR